MFGFLADWLSRPDPGRGVYKNGKEAFLAQVGSAIGLGNFWRFPYLCYRHGGSTFLMAYGVCMTCVGLPLYLLEVTLGQYVGLGPTHLFAYLCPLLSGVGWGMTLVLFMINVYYFVILSWSIFYTGASFHSPLPWALCLDGDNKSACDQRSVHEFYPSAVDYFNNVVLGQAKEGQSQYELHGWLVLCLGLAWALMCVCLVQGIRHTGKLLYVTVLYPYVVIICLFGINYENISAGSRQQWINNLSHVDLGRLLKLDIWSAAASQVIYSLGLGHGLIMIVSHNPRYQNVVRDTFLLCLVDMGTSILCSFVLFSLIAPLPEDMILNSNEHNHLVFILFSAMLSRLNSSLWSLLFFTMIFALGFDSMLLMVKAITTTIFDLCQPLRRFHSLFIIGVCLAYFLLGLPMCTRGGIVVLELMNDYVLKHSTFFLTFLEIVIASYFYGYRKVLKLMKEDLKVWVPLPLRWYLTVTWTLVTPASLLFLWGSTLYAEDWTGQETGGGRLYLICGHVMSLAPVAVVPIFALRAYCTRGEKSMKELVSATSDLYNNGYRTGGGDEPAPAEGGMAMRNLGYQIDYPQVNLGGEVR